MDAGEAAAVVVACASVAALVVMIWAVVALTRTLGAMRDSVEELRRATLPVVSELDGTVGQANAELARVHELLDTAENVSVNVDALSRLAYLAVATPVVKVLALGAGARGAARRLRQSSTR